ncbi:unnamed protein product [Malus baccata var. baccata]
MLSMIHGLCYIYMMIMANYLTAGALAIAHTNFSTDQSALLALKAHITSDPQNILTTNWSSASNSNICTWVGITCGARHHRVTALNLSYMGLAGIIPPHLGNLSFLVELGLKNNSFHGPLPQELSRLRRLKWINFRYNNFMGTIPSWFGSFPKLRSFTLQGNRFSGFIPAAIFNLSALEGIELSSNQLSGSIPREIGNLTMVKGIYLDDNKFEELPNEIGSLGQLEELYVRNNALKGSAFMHVLNISSLTALALTGNNMSGSLPDNICEHLSSIRLFYLNRNQLDGLIPSKLWQCKELHELSLGHNNFCGSIPKSLGNLTYLTYIFLGDNYLTGTLSNGIDVAVKVFNLQLEGALKSFDKECEMLSNIRHRNLIKIISCCDELDFKALILQLMPNGSLEKWLYSPNRSMNILQRLDIMKDVALALEYLHHGYSKPIVHCDLKPSNILLDDDMVAHVADFGIARLIGGGDSMTETMTLATIGYMAPEYGMEGSISTRGDVYSFGIVLMETFTKRKPTDEMFVGEMDLKEWIADSLFPNAAIGEVVDTDILGAEEDGDFVSKRDCLLSVMSLLVVSGLVKRDTNHVVRVPQVAELGDLLKEVTDKSIRSTEEFEGQNKSIKSRVRSTLLIWNTFAFDKVVDVSARVLLRLSPHASLYPSHLPYLFLRQMRYLPWKHKMLKMSTREQCQVRTRPKEKTGKKHDMGYSCF